MADLWQTLGNAITCLLAVFVRRLLRVCFRELRIWYSWSKLPPTRDSWCVSGDFSPSTALDRHKHYMAWTQQLGGIFGLRLGPLCVSPLHIRRSTGVLD